jgi:hypothetical protein
MDLWRDSRMTRRCLLRWLTTWLGNVAAIFACRFAIADQQVANLNETLRSVLKCRRAEEFAFIDLVTTKVQQGLLPVEMVLSMMKWARGRREDIPFPYFREGLKRRAAAMGVEL